jgi:hypothetical protein
MMLLHPNAVAARMEPLDPRADENSWFIKCANKHLANLVRGLVERHPTVAAELLIFYTGGLYTGFDNSEGKALMLAAEDVGVDLRELACQLS